eukprot:3075199-Amphidinium_carterae.2
MTSRPRSRSPHRVTGASTDNAKIAYACLLAEQSLRSQMPPPMFKLTDTKTQRSQHDGFCLDLSVDVDEEDIGTICSEHNALLQMWTGMLHMFFW